MHAPGDDRALRQCVHDHARWPRAVRADAAGCAFEAQGEGHVAEIIDARTFRLDDGREIRLAGIEPVVPEQATANRASALAAILAGRDVTLRGDDDTPDRYGREAAFVFLFAGLRRRAGAAPNCCWRKARRWSRPR